MKAAVLKEYGKFSWEERELREPSEGEVQVRTTFASICGTDMHVFSGEFDGRTKLPLIVGHEFAGVVEKCGPGVSGFSSGEKVVVDPIIWCGTCQACKSGQYPACDTLKVIGIDQDGGFCQYINVDQGMLFRAAPHVKDEHLALTEIFAIGFHASRRAGVQPGDTLAIWGSGRVGQVILQAARTITQGDIIMVDIVDSRLQIAKENNENVFTVNALNEDPIEKIMEYTGGNGTDIAFEAVGHPHFPDRTVHPVRGAVHPVRGAVQSIRGGGKVCVLGLSNDPAPVVFKELILKEATIIASRVSHGEYPTVIEHLEKGLLKPDALISDIMPARRVQEAFEKMENDPVNNLKILLDFTS